MLETIILALLIGLLAIVIGIIVLAILILAIEYWYVTISLVFCLAVGLMIINAFAPSLLTL